MNKRSWICKAEKLHKITSQIKQLNLEKSQLIEALKELQNHESFSYDRYEFAKVYTRGSVDYTSIPELQNIDLDAYRKENSERWLFKVLY